MKKLIVFLIFFAFLAIVQTACAHPPSEIKINFDSKAKMLEAVIIHNTSNLSNHYIKKVDVGLNGREIISQSISRQDNLETQTVSYLLPDIKSRDEVSVEGYCSMSGKLEKKIKVNIEQ